MPPFCFGVRSLLESFSCETMKVSIDDVPNWEFEIEEVSAGVDRLRGSQPVGQGLRPSQTSHFHSGDHVIQRKGDWPPFADLDTPSRGPL